MHKKLYPYEYMDDVDNFKDRPLPPTKAFHSKHKNSQESQSKHIIMQRTYIIFSTAEPFKTTTTYT
jgi:hypothetical protein